MQKKHSVQAVVSMLEAMGFHSNFLRQTFHFLLLQTLTPSCLKPKESLFAVPSTQLGTILFCSPTSSSECAGTLHISILHATHQNSAINIAAFTGSKHLLFTEQLMKCVQKCSFMLFTRVIRTKLKIWVNKLFFFLTGEI